MPRVLELSCLASAPGTEWHIAVRAYTTPFSEPPRLQVLLVSSAREVELSANAHQLETPADLHFFVRQGENEAVLSELEASGKEQRGLP